MHFSRQEYTARQAVASQAVKDAGLDAILLFAPESHFYVCGYDTFGFAMFQCLVLGADGRLNLLTRTPDLRQAQQTSTLNNENIHIWPDIEGVDPAAELAKLIAKLGYAGTLGIETQTVGLTFANGQAVTAQFGERLKPANGLVRDLRQSKSEAELEMHRRAASLSDDALDAALAITKAGAFEGDILAAMQGAVFKGGGDYAGNEFVIGSGDRARLCRYASGRRHLDNQDQLTIEWSGTYARYHAAMMQTLVIGKASDQQRKMHAVCRQALEACEAAILPGRPMSDVYDAHAIVFDEAGFGHARLKACGYGMGAIYNPIWVDFPMFYEGNPMLWKQGQVFFLHMILMDDETGYAMCLGHSVEVTENGAKRLSRHAPDLFEL